MRVTRVGPAAPGPVRRLAAGAGFRMPGPANVAGPGAVSGPALLGLQEAPGTEPDTDQATLDGSAAVLDTLRDVQLSMLDGHGAPAIDAMLAGLGTPQSPVLAALVDAIRVRAEVTAALLAQERTQSTV